MKLLLLAAFCMLAGALPAFADDQGDYGPDWPVCRNLVADPQTEIDACTRLIGSGRLIPQHLSWAYNNRGGAWIRLNDARRGVTDFLQSEQIDPTNKSPYFNLGLVLNRVGQFNAAVEQFDKAIALGADYPHLYCERGQALQALGRRDEAVASFEQAVQKHPDDACAAAHLARAYRESGRDDDALAVLDRSIKASPKSSMPFYERALTYEDMHQEERALSDFSSAVDINPQDELALLARGSLYAERGEYDSALSDLNAAIGLAPDDWQGFERRARVNFLRRDDQSALDDCRRSLALRPIPIPCAGIQLRSAMMLGNFNAAAGNATELIDAHETGYLLYRGASQFAGGDLSSAASDFAQYTAAAPDDPYGWLWLYLADRGQGKDDSAKMKELAQRRDAWPIMIIRYAVGAATADEVMASVDVPDPNLKRMRTAEADYYIGELAALKGDATAAAARFKASLAVGRAEINPLAAILVYKDDDDLELALANAALQGKGL